jgi:hypothetical protein
MKLPDLLISRPLDIKAIRARTQSRELRARNRMRQILSQLEIDESSHGAVKILGYWMFGIVKLMKYGSGRPFAVKILEQGRYLLDEGVSRTFIREFEALFCLCHLKMEVDVASGFWIVEVC